MREQIKIFSFKVKIGKTMMESLKSGICIWQMTLVIHWNRNFLSSEMDHFDFLWLSKGKLQKWNKMSSNIN